MIKTTHHKIKAACYKPDVITKELAIANCGDKRRIILSSNFLRLVGFEPGVRHDVKSLPNLTGIELSFNHNGSQKVYERTYKTRRNNPFESQIDIQNQTLINAGIPKYTERVHFDMRHGKIIVRPLINKTFNIRKRFVNASDYAAFVAMTSGIDVRCLIDCGFKIDSILEYRPQEKRDSTNLTETGALNAIANSHPRLLINEDISKVEMERIGQLMEDAPPISLLQISLQCDDFSNLKTNKAKANSLDSLDSSSDLVYDGLRLIETVKPAVVMVENVEGFSTSAQGDMLRVKLRKWGYFVADGIFNGAEYNGLTGRKRFYLVASVWPNFSFPEALPIRTSSIWSNVEEFLPGCRDVSHTNSVQLGITTGRIRLLTPETKICPTITKSQNRQAKDSLYIYHNGKYLLPSVELLAHLNGIPSDINYNCVADTIRSEIIGQSIEYPLHEKISQAVKTHIQLNAGNRSIVSINKLVS